MQNKNSDGQKSPLISGWRGISGSTVKLVGIITMFIDHFAAALIFRVILNGGYTRELYNFYLFLREVGRLGFPIFCFLLVEGFEKTRSKTKYALRLGLFALISEIPFDLAFSAVWMEFEHQNVYFTLFLGMLALCAYDFLGKRNLPKILRWGLDMAVLVVIMLIADFLKTDYSGMGVLTITVMYALRRSRLAAMAGGCVVLAVMDLRELPAFLTLLPVAAYNGERGWKLKYFFYAFYPAHLLLLWLIAKTLGLGDISVMAL